IVPAAREPREFRRGGRPGLPGVEGDVAGDSARAAVRVSVLLPEADQVRRVLRVHREGRLYLRVRKENGPGQRSFAPRVGTARFRERTREENARDRKDSPRGNGHRGAISSEYAT